MAMMGLARAARTTRSWMATSRALSTGPWSAPAWVGRPAPVDDAVPSSAWAVATGLWAPRPALWVAGAQPWLETPAPAVVPLPLEAPAAPDAEGLPESVPLQCLKRTYQPGLRSRKRKHGYLGRMDTANGRRVLRSRRRKGRHQLSI